MDRERPLEGGDWRVKTHPAPSPYQALGLGGRSRHRPQAPERQHRSGGRAGSARTPARYGHRGLHMKAAFRCTCTPMSHVHSRIGTDRHSSASQEPSRTPRREALDGHSGLEISASLSRTGQPRRINGWVRPPGLGSLRPDRLPSPPSVGVGARTSPCAWNAMAYEHLHVPDRPPYRGGRGPVPPATLRTRNSKRAGERQPCELESPRTPLQG